MTTVHTRLPNSAASAGRFRQVLRRELADRVSPTTLANAQLVASELVTNAWRHGKGAIEARVSVADDRLRIQVKDQGEAAGGTIRPTPPGGSAGFGLRIVEDLALSWGVSEGTTTVWAELPL